MVHEHDPAMGGDKQVTTLKLRLKQNLIKMIEEKIKLGIYNLVDSGIKYDLDDFESFLFENDFKAISPKLFLLVASHVILLYGLTWWGGQNWWAPNAGPNAGFGNWGPDAGQAAAEQPPRQQPPERQPLRQQPPERQPPRQQPPERQPPREHPAQQ